MVKFVHRFSPTVEAVLSRLIGNIARKPRRKSAMSLAEANAKLDRMRAVLAARDEASGEETAARWARLAQMRDTLRASRLRTAAINRG